MVIAWRNACAPQAVGSKRLACLLQTCEDRLLILLHKLEPHPTPHPFFFFTYSHVLLFLLLYVDFMWSL